jgi:hypothetical protein
LGWKILEGSKKLTLDLLACPLKNFSHILIAIVKLAIMDFKADTWSSNNETFFDKTTVFLAWSMATITCRFSILRLSRSAILWTYSAIGLGFSD